MTICLPYVASCTIGGEKHDNLEVVKLNGQTVYVKLPNGDIIKRHIYKNKVELKFVRVTDGYI